MTANKLPIPRVEVVPQFEKDKEWNIYLYATERECMWRWYPTLSTSEVHDLAGTWAKATGWALVIDGKVVELSAKSVKQKGEQ